MKSRTQSCRNTLALGIILFLAGNPVVRADNVFVSDATDGTILQFDSSGNESIFASGLDQPTGLVFGNNGDLYVAEAGSGTILQFSAGGHQSVFASGLNNPTGLAVDGSGQLYVANSGAGTILQFSSSGNGSVFASGLASPGYLAVDNSGNLYASTPHNILQFDSSGNGSTIYSALNSVYGIAFDSAGALYASLENVGSIVRLSGGVAANGIAFNDPLHTAPTGLAFGSGDNLYVAFGGVNGTYNPMGGDIEQYGPGATGSLFALGLSNPLYLTVQSAGGIGPIEFVPEPSIYAMAIAGIAVLIVRRTRHQRQS
ncbi:MAG TPA: NHL repeat-containing protein [Candidatus Acidoferrales bacterium]|nr:NHL repeat-containing protein [Candidatus Acidoferrales bacterium]